MSVNVYEIQVNLFIVLHVCTVNLYRTLTRTLTSIER